MSQAAHEAFNVGGIAGERMDTSGNRHFAQSAQFQASQGQSSVVDGSGPLFTMYVKLAEEEDNKTTERWQKDADGILIFTGLFSAAVAILVAVSVQDLRPNPQDITAFYLENIYQLLADTNVSRASILATPAKPPPFSPPKYAIWVNSLWFLSLAISLTCALLATLLHQWARRYLQITQLPRYTPHKRARIRAFFADGVDKLHLPWAVEALPTLLHLSLFLFFSGLIIFLFNINHTVFNVVVWWVGLSAGVYACITLVPIFRHDSPYYAPLSSIVWLLYTGMLYAVFQILWLLRNRLVLLFGRLTLMYFDVWRRTYRDRFLRGIVKTAQETASKLSAEIDGNVLKWTFGALEEDHELEQFFDGIPGFCTSRVVHNPRASLSELGDLTLGDALGRFLDRTWSSSSEAVKERRVMICVKAVDTGHLPNAANGILRGVFEQGVDGVLLSVQIGHSLRGRVHSVDRGSSLCAQGIVAGIIASVRERDGHWLALAMDQLGISEGMLRRYLTHGDSVLLANLIHITRQFLPSYLEGDAWMASALLHILPSISKFDIQNTLPGLRHDFCHLWNEIAEEARKSGSYRIPISILRNIRHLYMALHEGTDAAPIDFSASTKDRDPVLFRSSSYPSCNIPSHRSHVPRIIIGAIGEIGAHASAAPSPIVSYPNAIFTTVSPSTRHDPSSFPAPTRTVLPTTPIADSSHPAPPVDVQKPHRPSLRSATAGTAEHMGHATLSTANSKSDPDPRPIPAASTSSPQTPVPSSSIRTVTPQRNADLGVVTPSVIPGVPPSSFLIPVHSNTLPADPQSNLAPPASQTGQLTLDPRFLLSTPATTISLAPRATSVSRPNMVTNGASPDMNDNSRAPDFPKSMEDPYPSPSS